MVGTVVAGAVAGIAGALTVASCHRFTGCRGGHVWSEWEPVECWEATPWEHYDDVQIRGQYRRECTRSGCRAEETEYREEYDRVYATSVEEVLTDTVEVHYECPSCDEQVVDSERETKWGGTSSHRTRKEGCPECNEVTDSTYWNRVPLEELEDRDE